MKLKHRIPKPFTFSKKDPGQARPFKRPAPAVLLLPAAATRRKKRREPGTSFEKPKFRICPALLLTAGCSLLVSANCLDFLPRESPALPPASSPLLGPVLAGFSAYFVSDVVMLLVTLLMGIIR
ncbi:hypothetical protein SLEP1_g12275 [Rubroshorea leprosula]|uniref:Uncharacterized protein n=1 Tax=Rubroshorea leprosula TaxID=152421 RepID=A0AAV5IC02_9ROSI|nr:hypothetical protein SLEP1_g12275 [Rubroshorea leprosula]